MKKRPKLSPTKQALLEKRLLGNSERTVQMQPVSRDGDLPLSSGQRRMWFLSQFDPTNPAYNCPEAIRLKGSLNVGALERSLNEILRRHEALRTTFRVIDRQPVQRIVSAPTFILPIIDLRHLSKANRQLAFDRLATEDIQRLFDLTRAPLFRATLIRLGDQDHVLLFVAHHITHDGWSFGVFMREMAALYEAFSASEPSPLPELPIQYADFAHWERQWLQGDILETQLAYWKNRLAGDLPVLHLPTDRPRPPVQTYRGSRRVLELPADLLKDIKALCRGEGATLYMILLAAFLTLLHRYTGQKDILVGSPIANRNWPEIEGLIGYFANMLALQFDLNGKPTFRELLGRVREVALGAYTHQNLPFGQLVEELHPERDLSRTPLFQVLFVLQNIPMPDLELPGLSLSFMDVDSGTSRFDLSLSIRENEQGLACRFEYNTDLFDESTITRMTGHFQTLLEGVVANPDQHIATLPLLTEAERHKLLVEWNDTTANYPRDACIHELFEQQVERTPDAVALVFKGEEVTYQELNRRASQLGHYLSRIGVGPEVLVGICVERSVEMIVGMLGILKAGGTYLPLAPTYPKERLAFMLEDAQAQVLLTQGKLASELPDHARKVICLDSDWETIGKESEENPTGRATPDSLAYVIYTSGSTGRPKGVMIAHRGLCNLSEMQIRTFGLKPGDRVLQFASLGFDAFTFEIIMALRVGATLCLATRDSLLPGPGLIKLLRELSINMVTLPPSTLAFLLAEELPDLRILAVAGEACPADLVARWGKGRRFLNLYGPTETTVWTTVAECVDSNRKLSIGRPIANTEVYVLDGHMQPVPVGVPGELYIGGVSLARGYLNQAELTAEKYVSHPFRNEPGARLYRTGDLVRYLPNGNIDFLGRIDRQVKIRGYRIEVGEIEAVLKQHPSVRDTVILAREDHPGDKRLVAYVVPRPEQDAMVSEMRRFLKEKLPEYMVPFAFVLMDALPVTASGKVDYRALLPPAGTNGEQHRALVPPGTPVEEVLVELWAEVLGLEDLCIYDNFFDLGGHSLLATQIMSRVRDILQVELPLRRLFEAPTVAGLAAAILSDSGQPARIEKIAKLVIDMARLSEQEVEVMLEHKSSVGH